MWTEAGPQDVEIEEVPSYDCSIAPIHPGEVLLEEFIEPLGVTQHQLAVSIGVPPRRINEIVNAIGPALNQIRPLQSA